jgi:EAL and modified HD-GYP domain-containing signal transduction protein
LVRLATHSLPDKILADALPEQTGAVRYVARQPIMDLRGRVHGYELLYRAGPETAFRGDGDLATRIMLDNTVMFGLGRLSGGLPAFVNCTREALIEELVHVLPTGMTVLEILENLEPTPALVKACRKLKAAGFRLALDDFTWKPKIEPLVKLADYIKVDFLATGFVERRSLLRRLSSVSVALLAEKVETQEEFEQAREEGFTLFQGYYFCRPVLLKNRKVPANRLAHIEILQLLHQDPIELRKLSHLVKRDASLTYRLLRLVNSPMCAMRREVNSVQSALVALGEDIFRRILTLAITSELSVGQPVEVLRMATVRGRFCELAAKLCALNPTEQYLLGMMSLLPAMLRVPMEELAPALPFREEIRHALQGEHNSKRALLQWLECHERGDWSGSDAVIQANHLNQVEIVGCYGEAVQWAEAALHSAG